MPGIACKFRVQNIKIGIQSLPERTVAFLNIVKPGYCRLDTDTIKNLGSKGSYLQGSYPFGCYLSEELFVGGFCVESVSVCYFLNYLFIF